MKKIILSSAIALGVAGIPLLSPALDAPFSTDAPPTQSYRSLDFDTKSISPAAPAVVQTPPAVQPIAPTVNSSPDAVGVDLNLQTQMGILNQTVSGYEQQTAQRIENLNDSNHAIGVAIQTMTQNIATLQQQVSVLQQADAKNMAPTSSAKTFAEYTGFGAGAIFMVGFGVVLGRVSRRSEHAKAKNIFSPIQSKASEQSEYDFRETSEAIPGMLDLARSYLVMQDAEQAKSILKIVIEKGNAEQRNEAQSLMKKIIQKI